ncbi:hypothetical protein AXA44_31135 [Rhodococcus sp. SC4]|nr:hypothetical protein AXA44_31135 [Rhodococcus sp. SC4]KXX61876.1 hypothetical protein AZG88_31540 [Rhodococcus sp. LB1]
MLVGAAPYHPVQTTRAPGVCERRAEAAAPGDAAQACRSAAPVSLQVNVCLVDLGVPLLHCFEQLVYLCVTQVIALALW